MILDDREFEIIYRDIRHKDNYEIEEEITFFRLRLSIGPSTYPKVEPYPRNVIRCTFVR